MVGSPTVVCTHTVYACVWCVCVCVCVSVFGGGAVPHPLPPGAWAKARIADAGGTCPGHERTGDR